MANTTNLNLKKPLGTEQALIADINGNMDILDSTIGAPSSASAVDGANAFAKINSLNSNKANVKALNLTNTISASSTAALETALLTFVANNVNSDGVAAVVLKLSSGVTAPLYPGGWGATIQKASNNYFSLICSNNYYPPVLIQYNNGDWFINELSCVKTKEVTGTTGTTQYHGYYYADIDVGVTGYTFISAMLRGTASNLPAFIGYLNGEGKVRVFSQDASTTAYIRVAYI